METLNLVQGSPEWHQHRVLFRNASESSAAMNLHPTIKRNELIHAKKTGDVKQFSEWFQKYILDKGHRFEALARPIADRIIGEMLFPVVGVDGEYSASFDGLTMSETRGFEHKTMNDEIRAATCAENLPIYHRVQMEHQLMVSSGESILFMASRWEPVEEDHSEEEATYGYALNEKGVMTRYMLVEEVHYEYFPDFALRAEIIAAWEQLDKDIEAYEPQIIESAPALREISEFPIVAVAGRELLSKAEQSDMARRIAEYVAPTKTVPQTKQEAGDLVNCVEKVKAGEAMFKALAEAQSVSEADRDAFRAWLTDMQKVCANARIEGGKALDAFKQNQKVLMIENARKAVSDHVDVINASLPSAFIAVPEFDYWLVIKGKSNPDNMQNDLAAAVADLKIGIDATHRKIVSNYETYTALSVGYETLFDDLLSIIENEEVVFTAIVKTRIADHKEKLQREEQERIRAEEEAARLKREAEARAEQDRILLENEKKLKAQAEENERLRAEMDRMRVQTQEVPAVNVENKRAEQQTQADEPAIQEPAPVIAQPAPNTSVQAPNITQAAANTAPGATMSLGQINSHLAPISLTKDGLAALGIHPVGKERAAILYSEADMPNICAALVRHISAISLKKAA